MYKYIICGNVGGLGTITLSSEKTLNSLSVPMIAEIHSVLKQWKDDDEIACVFLQGAGEKAFCAGGDVRRLHDAIIKERYESPGVVPQDCLDFFVEEYRLDYEIHRYPKPIVVWADGIVMGGGIGLAAGASHRIVTERSKLAMPEITIGLYPDVGGTWFLNRMPKGFGLYLGLTGTRLNAADCIFVDLADYYIPSNLKVDVVTTLLEADWAQGSAAKNYERVTELLTGISAGHQPAESPAMVHQEFVSKFAVASSFSEVHELLSECVVKDDWINVGIKAFQSGSPSSAHIIFEQLKRGKDLSLEEVFRSELNLSAQCTIHPDFAEGVRALLVDKDHSPNWQPASFAEISETWVEGYFTALWTSDNHPLKQLGSYDAVRQN